MTDARRRDKLTRESGANHHEAHYHA